MGNIRNVWKFELVAAEEWIITDARGRHDPHCHFRAPLFHTFFSHTYNVRKIWTNNSYWKLKKKLPLFPFFKTCRDISQGTINLLAIVETALLCHMSCPALPEARLKHLVVKMFGYLSFIFWTEKLLNWFVRSFPTCRAATCAALAGLGWGGQEFEEPAETRDGAGDGEWEDPPPSSILSIALSGAGLPPLPPELLFGESAEAGGGWAPCCRYQGFKNIVTALVLLLSHQLGSRTFHHWQVVRLKSFSGSRPFHHCFDKLSGSRTFQVQELFITTLTSCQAQLRSRTSVMSLLDSFISAHIDPHGIPETMKVSKLAKSVTLQRESGSVLGDKLKLEASIRSRYRLQLSGIRY